MRKCCCAALVVANVLVFGPDAILSRLPSSRENDADTHLAIVQDDPVAVLLFTKDWSR